jgi:hypothetical protein
MGVWKYIRNTVLPAVVGSDLLQGVLVAKGVPPVLLDKLEDRVKVRAEKRKAEDNAEDKAEDTAEDRTDDSAADVTATADPAASQTPQTLPVMSPRPSIKLTPTPTPTATPTPTLEKETIPMTQKQRPDTATYGLEHAHVFPYYQTREEYEKATNKPCPPYLDTGRPKYWEGTVEANADPDLSIRFTVAYNSLGGVSRSADGQPRPSLLDLKPEEIVRVNIPPKGVGSFPGKTSAVEIQPPIELLPNEKLEFQTGGIASAQLRIRNTSKTPTPATMSERQLLEGIYSAVVKPGV